VSPDVAALVVVAIGGPAWATWDFAAEAARTPRGRRRPGRAFQVIAAAGEQPGPAAAAETFEIIDDEERPEAGADDAIEKGESSAPG
jgi:hypothetical protein